jgi:hypothetical protein
MTAKVVNATRGRWGELWDGDQPHVLELIGEDAIVAACGYVLANPVKAGLVEHGRDWPGFRTTPNGIGLSETFRRPAKFFSESGVMPETATLTLAAPPGTEAARFGKLLASRVEAAEATARKAARDAGRHFAGVRRVLATPWQRAAMAPETRRAPKPVVAAPDPETKVAYVAWLFAFRKAHDRALGRWLAGERGVLFPTGTYLMRRRFGVRCRREPP